MTAREIKLELPSYFEDFRDVLVKSTVDYIQINPTTHQSSACSSKMGGQPYLPPCLHLPKDFLGKDMLLLAQINFADSYFPAPFPSKGLLQFFISSTLYEQASTLNGICHHQTFHVRYISEADVQDLERGKALLPSASMLKEYSLFFDSRKQPVSLTDYQLSHFISEETREQFSQQHFQLFDELYGQFNLAAEHKMGGYAYFIDADFRSSHPHYHQYDMLLLQLLSDDKIDFMWGDCGNLKFFISTEDLTALDFSNVLLYCESY